VNVPTQTPALRSSGRRAPGILSILLLSLSPIACAQSPTPAPSSPPPASGDPAPASTAPSSSPDSAQLLTVLLDPAAEPVARDTAADQLIALSQRPDVARLLINLLREPQDPDRSRAILLAAFSRAWDPPGRLFQPIVEITAQDPGLAPDALLAIGAYRTREAAQILIHALSGDTPPAQRQAAIAALVRMTGREELWNNPSAAATWLENAQSLNHQAWENLLAQGVWRRTQRLEADQRAAAERLTDGYRRLYLALPAAPSDERAKLLAQMLQGTRPELRGLGIEIVAREVSAGKRVEPSVTEAALTLLAAPTPAVRTAAAGLIMQIAAPNAAAPLAAALAKETDPVAASALLQAAVRWPTPASIEPSLKWMRLNPSTFPAAAESVFALYSGGLLKDPGHRATALVALREVDAARLTPAGCRLLAALGTREDRDRVSTLIDSDAPALRLAAAGALADRPEYLDRILAAAAKEPALFSTAVRAVTECRPTADGYGQLVRLNPGTPEDLKNGLLILSAALPAVDLVKVAARADTTLPMREAMLARLAQHGPMPRRAGEEDSKAIMEGLLVLAETRLAMKRPDLAAAALEIMPRSPAQIEPARLNALRAVSLIWSNQLDAAKELNAPCDSWLDGLERAQNDPHAPAIIKEIKARFSPTMTPEQTDRFSRLMAKVTLTTTGEIDHPLANGQTPPSPQDPGR